MATPTISFISPTSGWTGGRELVEVYGTNFRLPDPPPSTGPAPAPVPSVKVTFGGSVCPAVWVVSSTLLRVLTPIHDPSGVRSRSTPTGDDLPASDVVVQNLDASGEPIPSESATMGAAFSFQRPLLDASTYTTRAIDQLITEFRRQVHPNVAFNPHTDWDSDSGDALNLVELATLPGIGLTGLRLPTSKDIGDREQIEVDLGDGRVAVRAQPVIRDAVLTCIGVSDNERELQALEMAVRIFARDNASLTVADPPAEYVLDYQRGDAVTFTDRTNGVMWFTSEFAIRRICEYDMPGVNTSGPEGLGVHQATRGIAYKADRIGVSGERK